MDRCGTCGVADYFPRGDMRALLEPVGTQWPDLIGTGSRVGLFVASGRFVGVKYCPSCGARSHDIRVTNKVRFVFDYDASLRLDLFTTDMNPRAFFCTERVPECAREHRPTNVAISRVEDGPIAKSLKFW